MLLTSLFLIIGNRSEKASAKSSLPEVDITLNSQKLIGNKVITKEGRSVLDDSSKSLYKNNVKYSDKMILLVKADVIEDRDVMVVVYSDDKLIASGTLESNIDLTNILVPGEHELYVIVSFENIDVISTLQYKIVVTKQSPGK